MRYAALLSTFVALFAVSLAAPTPSPAQERPSAVVLMYHRFGEDAYPSTNIRLEQFEDHLRYLQAGDYEVLSLPRIVQTLRAGKSLPDRTVAITIDDAYRSAYTEAWPRLREAGFPFTLFVATEPVDRGFAGMMSWKQLREMAASVLVTVGNHTVSHLHMPDHDTARLRDEIRQADRRLRDELGEISDLFAYPYGEYGTRVQQVVRDTGFGAAFGQHSGVIGTHSDFHAMPRFALNEQYGAMERFRLVADALPLMVSDVTPEDVHLTDATNPPSFALTLADDMGDPERLSCYGSGRGRLTLQSAGARRVRALLDNPFPPGRSRINCTLRDASGRWRWYGLQFYVSSP